VRIRLDVTPVHIAVLIADWKMRVGRVTNLGSTASVVQTRLANYPRFPVRDVYGCSVESNARPAIARRFSGFCA
jgi:hypothetical protein